ncbi:hypothetical protein HCJ76_43960 [Streptomyces sp. MC1]|uniref:hypothetical protein n=1 Tax=Streptomyces sp. MC1 TaxID=295105 RepID=UPI0018CAFF61|nr:hypothetical protein [Streptomyces sp. MC1]MBG7704839.1 hypothetical protein [Streptomyces sp. MC1]
MNTIDYDQLRTTVEQEVTEELAKVTDPLQRRARAEAIRDQAQREATALMAVRDELVVAAALADGRVTKELADSTGLAYAYAQKRVMAYHRAELPGIARAFGRAVVEELRARTPLHREPDIHARAIEAARKYEIARARQRAALRNIEAAHEAVLTAGGRIRVDISDTGIDFAEVRRQAAEELRAEYAELNAGPEERLRWAAEAVDQAESEMELLQPERDRALISLAFYTTARAPYQAAGLSRQRMRRYLERALGLPALAKLPPREQQPAAARAAGVPFVEDAATELPQIAEMYEAAAERRQVALEIRNAALRTLAAEPYGWTQTKLAEFIGRDLAVVNRALNAAA